MSQKKTINQEQKSNFGKQLITLLICLTGVVYSNAQFVQQGPKLIGTEIVGEGSQGFSVSIAADGNTAVVGGPFSNGFLGAIWVYKRVGNNWIQDGPKLVGTGGIFSTDIFKVQQGFAVDISADGNTIIVGGPHDDWAMGAVWIFIRSNGVWVQQGPKLVGTGAIVGNHSNSIRQGCSVSISADGNTAVVGGESDGINARPLGTTGAVWIYTRSNGVWTQQGQKLNRPNSNERSFGESVSISANGNTILIGANDNLIGGAWVYTRSNSIWTQQGPKLIGTGGGAQGQGNVVAISADGNTAIIGSSNYNLSAWVFIRVGAVWLQQGSKLVPTETEGVGVSSLALSANGDKAIIGNAYVNSTVGAAWVFDRNNNVWSQTGPKIVGANFIGPARYGFSTAISNDGTTLIVGGPSDNERVGAAWVYTTGIKIDSFLPKQAAVGDTVKIYGSGFQAVSGVSFGGTPAASYWVDSTNKIFATVGNAGTSGNVMVTTPFGSATKSGFTIALPTITNFNPVIAGEGATVTITGTNLTGASAVSFGGLPAVSFTVISKNTISAKLGEGTSGTVSVTTPGGTATKTGFYAIPTITAFTPAIAGAGETVYITGTNFIEVSSVSFGGTPAASFFINSRNNLTAVLGKGSSGTVTVSTPGGTAIKTGFIAKPTITSFTPFAAGVNNTVIIFGTNFTGATAVSFGGIASNGFTVLGDSIITAIVGPGAPGDVAVVTPGGTATAPGFAYVVVLFPPPVVNSFSPASGTKGTLITINGSNFDSVKAVSIGGVTATSFSINSNISITAVVGKTISGNVSVTSKGGTGSKAGFTYITPAPTITSISPSEGESGTSITIKGTNLSEASIVSFGGATASSFTIANDSTIIAKPGTGTSGSVAVTSPGGSTSRGGFIFLAPSAVTSFSPTSAATGTTVTISGNNFTGATSVKFGGTPAASYSVVNATTINAVVALGSSGLVSVTTPSGSGGLGGFTHVVSTPAITSFSPVSVGPGASITITGSNFSGVYAVKLGGVPVSSFNIVNNTTITAIVGAGSSGNVSVTNEAGTGSKTGFTFLPPLPPVISSFSPVIATNNMVVEIRGSLLANTTAVSFGGVPALSFQLLTDTSVYIRATIANGASGNINVTTPDGTASKTGFTYYSAYQQGINDTSFSVGTGADHVVWTTSLQTDGKIIIGGYFKKYNGTVRNGIARLNKDASVDLSFNPESGVNGLSVYTSTVQSDGKIIIGGDFIKFNTTDRKYIARINANGNVDLSFNPVLGPNKAVYTSAIQGDGKILIGGAFTTYNGSITNRITRLNPDGSIDASFNIGGTGADSTIEVLKLQSDGKIIIGGEFTTYNGVARNRIARLNSDGTLDLSFTPASGFSSTVLTIAIQSDGKIIVGGNFVTFNNISTRGIARLNGNGTLDVTLNPGTGLNSAIYTSAIQSDGKIIIGGGFTTYNGATINRIARINTNGSLDSSFSPGTGANGWVLTSIIQSDKKIIIGGTFTAYNGTPVNRITRVFTQNPLPKIISFFPVSGTPATTVIIRGSGLEGITNVAFGGNSAASFSILFDTAYYISATVGTGNSGNISVSKSIGTAVSSGVFTLITPGNDSLSLCPNGNFSLISNLTGSTYQWQVSSDTGYINLTNSIHFSGVNTNNLQFVNTPTDFRGSNFRCLVNGNSFSKISTLKFIVNWIGSADNAWENPGNWGCGGQVPDMNTDVIIGSGIVILNTTTLVKSVAIKPGVNVVIAPRGELNIAGQ